MFFCPLLLCKILRVCSWNCLSSAMTPIKTTWLPQHAGPISNTNMTLDNLSRGSPWNYIGYEGQSRPVSGRAHLNAKMPAQRHWTHHKKRFLVRCRCSVVPLSLRACRRAHSRANLAPETRHFAPRLDRIWTVWHKMTNNRFHLLE